MHRPKPNAARKHKPIHKQSHKNVERENQQILSEESEEHVRPSITKDKQIIYESAEQLKERLGREIVSKVKPQKIVDDFFVQPDNEEGKIEGLEDDQAINQRFKQEYLRKAGKLYQTLDAQFDQCSYEPTVYTGHTKCITGICVTPTHMVSVSKDRSIIKWDREMIKKEFISLGKEEGHHTRDILCVDLHSNGDVLATGGQDGEVRLWDLRINKLIQTLKGHRNTINGVKFGSSSHNLMSVSSDLTLKQWDFAQRGLIQTFYEHNGQVLDIDCINGQDFLTSGNDHQVICWKTQKQTKIIFKGHDYAIDRVKAINHQKFVTASMDGSINLWNNRKIKPVFKIPEAHSSWIVSLATLKQSNIVASGGADKLLKIWSIQGEMHGLKQLHQIQMAGIVTDIKLDYNSVAATECDEHRLGRWQTAKCRNRIKIFRITQQSNM